MTSIQYRHEAGRIPATLANLPFFSRLKRECLDALLNHASLLEVEPGEPVVREGSRTGALYFLLRGQLKVECNGSPMATLDQGGELFGELSYVANEPHGATVRATTHATILRIDASLKRSLPEEHLAHFERILYRFLTQLLASRLKKTSSRLAPGRDEPLVYEL